MTVTTEPKISDETTSDLPPWMKGMDETSLRQEVAEEMTTPVKTPDIADEDGIPDWLRGTPSETPVIPVEEIIPEIPKQEIIPEESVIITTESKEDSSYEDIPDWLRSTTPMASTEEDNTEEVSKDKEKVSILPEENPEKELDTKEETKPSIKKKAQKSVKKEEAIKEKEIIIEDEKILEEAITLPKPKKKKPAPVVSE